MTKDDHKNLVYAGCAIAAGVLAYKYYTKSKALPLPQSSLLHTFRGAHAHAPGGGDEDALVTNKELKKDVKEVKELTVYEKTLLNALRAEPTGLGNWMIVGNPNAKHREIVEMLVYTLDLCEKLEAEYWADWGTLLGVLRHRNVIPWDWDFDLSFRTADFKKIAALEKDPVAQAHPVYGWRWYSDPANVKSGYVGYDSLGFCVYNKLTDPKGKDGKGEESATLGDIVEYRDPKEGETHGQLVCHQEDWHYPNRNLSDIYPLKRVHILGTSIVIPANPKAILSWYSSDDNNTYAKINGETYDPAPFILSHLHNRDLEIHCKHPVQDVSEKKLPVSDWTGAVDAPLAHRNANDGSITGGDGRTPTDKPGVTNLPRPPPGFPKTSSDATAHVHHEHIFTPAFTQSDKGMYTRVVSGRFELLCVPPHLQHCLKGMAPDCPIDQLLWQPKSPLWNNMQGCFLEAGDGVYVPKGWSYRLRVILGKGAKPAVRLAANVA